MRSYQNVLFGEEFEYAQDKICEAASTGAMGFDFKHGIGSVIE